MNCSTESFSLGRFSRLYACLLFTEQMKTYLLTQFFFKFSTFIKNGRFSHFHFEICLLFHIYNRRICFIMIVSTDCKKFKITKKFSVFLIKTI